MYGLPCQVMGDTFLRALFLISMHASKRITAATVYSSCIGACEVALDIMKVAGAETIDTNDLEGHEGSRLHRAGGRSAQHESDRI